VSEPLSTIARREYILLTMTMADRVLYAVAVAMVSMGMRPIVEIGDWKLEMQLQWHSKMA
jgi:pyruvate/2-oxoglutarate/acetoin dehydrogenase E1 component